MRILLVEDTIDIGEAMAARLAQAGHAVDWARDGDTGAAYLDGGPYDVAILDLMLPGLQGEDLLRLIRQRHLQASVLITTARSAMDDRIAMLDLGADDYLVKPFEFREFDARVRSLLRRVSGDRSNLLVCGGVTLDRAARRVSVQGVPIVLTAREQSLVETLIGHHGRILSKAQLLDQLFTSEAEATENAIEVLVGRLRRKLGSAARIATHRGLGYSIEPA